MSLLNDDKEKLMLQKQFVDNVLLEMSLSNIHKDKLMLQKQFVDKRRITSWAPSETGGAQAS